MIKVSVLYPNTPDTKFDLEYYRTHHVPMVIERFGGALKRGEIEQGIAGGDVGSPAAYCIVGHLCFDSVQDFQSAMVTHGEEIMGDIPNFTNVQPTVQISEVLMSHPA